MKRRQWNVRSGIRKDVGEVSVEILEALIGKFMDERIPIVLQCLLPPIPSPLLVG